MGTLQPTKTVATISREQLEETITALHGRLEEVEGQPNRYCVPRGKEASTVERRQLSAAFARLEAQLEPCEDPLAIEALISQFFITFELGAGNSEVNTAALNERYVKALAGMPLGAIEAAIGRFDSARTLLPWNPAFRPKTGEFCAEVQAGMTGIRKKLVHVRRILAAEVYTPPTEEQKAAVHEATRKFLEDRRMAREAERQAPGREDRFDLEFSAAIDGLKAAGRHMDVSRLMPAARQREVSK